MEEKSVERPHQFATRSITSHSLSHFYLGIYACVCACVCVFLLHLVAAASCEKCGELIGRVFDASRFVSRKYTKHPIKVKA